MVYPKDLPVFPNQEAHSNWGSVLYIEACPISQAGLATRVRQQREREAESLRERRIQFDRIGTGTEDLHIVCFKIVDSITESDSFGRSVGGICIWIEPEKDLFATVVLQLDAFATMILQGEIRCRISRPKRQPQR